MAGSIVLKGAVLLFVVGVCYGSYSVQNDDTPDVAERRGTNPRCTSIVTINLEAQFTTQLNDIGITTPQGINVNVTTITTNDGDMWRDWYGVYPNNQIGGDFSNQPFAGDGRKQAVAKAQYSVTALTEPSATPIGFLTGTSYMSHSVCVYVRGVGRRWVEVMAETANANQQLCVSDWKPDDATTGRSNLASTPFEEACSNGNLYVCRQSGNKQTGETTYNDNLNLQFYCKDSCDDEVFKFKWRVVASQETPKKASNGQFVQPDGEDWCMKRNGADYPSSLLDPYPADYQPPVVFSVFDNSASSVAVSAVLLLVSLLALML